MNKAKLVLIKFLLLHLFIQINTQDFSYYYDNVHQTLALKDYSENSKGINIFRNDNELIANINLNSNNIAESKIFAESTKITSYESKAKNGTFTIESCNIKINDENYLISKISFPYNDLLNISEIIIDMIDSKNDQITFPKKYENSFKIIQNKKASVEASKNRKTKIYETFGFEIQSNDYEFIIRKIILVNYSKNKIHYIADLTNFYQVTFPYSNNKKELYSIFDFYLKNLPETFDLYITLDLLKLNTRDDLKEKILIVKKNINYPNYKLEKINPNTKMGIITFAITLLCIIGTIIIIIVKEK